jgi:hypothetical protein
MKKTILLIILSLTILTACSPQKKLDNLLKRYPELVKDSSIVTVKYKDTTVINYSYQDTLVKNPCLENVDVPTEIASVKTSTGAKASLILFPSKDLLLVAEQLDTTIISDKEQQIKIPTFKIEHKAKNTFFQKYLLLSGIIFNILIFFMLLLFIRSFF